MDKNTFYITTPIYYPSGNWHIGTCYTTVVCDSIARFNRMLKKEVFFLTGTDEHGQKIEEKAKALGKTPIEFIDPIVDDLKSIWEMLGISYDKFIRTTSSEHVSAVKKIFTTLYEKGQIYKSEYSGMYCTPCESFWTETQLKDGKCPDCGREVHLEKEESYFFRLSEYGDKLLQYYKDNPEFLQPKSRLNEMINFINEGLQDLCVSRTSVKWGIPVDFDEKHVVYVWLDALTNYITALGYDSENTELFEKFWPANVHMTAKEIVRFHAIIWPAILMALDLPLPKRVYGHGWLLIGGDKLSKSKGDKINTELTDPKEIVARYGSDALRYFLLREIPFGNDGVYTNESLLVRINSDLANDLGNLVSRTTAMINQYFNGILPEASALEDIDNSLIEIINGAFEKVNTAVDELNVPKALQEIFKIVSRANKYIDETCPWLLAKDESKKARLQTVLYNLSEAVRVSAILLKPFIPKAPVKILAAYGIDADKIVDFDLAKYGVLSSGIVVEKSAPLFPRIDVKKELAEIDKMMLERHKKAGDNKAQDKKNEKPKGIVENPEPIDIEQFFKTELRVAKVIDAENVDGSDKLIKLSLSLGAEKRTVVSGIKQFYTPDELKGKMVILVANLKPAKLKGIESQGMILCAEKDGKLSIVSPEKDMPEGSRVR